MPPASRGRAAGVSVAKQGTQPKEATRVPGAFRVKPGRRALKERPVPRVSKVKKSTLR